MRGSYVMLLNISTLLTVLFHHGHDIPERIRSSSFLLVDHSCTPSMFIYLNPSSMKYIRSFLLFFFLFFSFFRTTIISVEYCYTDITSSLQLEWTRFLKRKERLSKGINIAKCCVAAIRSDERSMSRCINGIGVEHSRKRTDEPVLTFVFETVSEKQGCLRVIISRPRSFAVHRTDAVGMIEIDCE